MKHVEELIRGELAAVKSIEAILPRIKDQTEIQTLQGFCQDHKEAVSTLRRYANAEFAEDVNSSGPWGAFAAAFTGSASFFGEKAAVNALKIGEEHGVNEYKEALKDGAISPELKTVIESRLIPQQLNHITTLERYVQ